MPGLSRKIQTKKININCSFVIVCEVYLFIKMDVYINGASVFVIGFTAG